MFLSIEDLLLLSSIQVGDQLVLVGELLGADQLDQVRQLLHLGGVNAILGILGVELFINRTFCIILKAQLTLLNIWW